MKNPNEIYENEIVFGSKKQCDDNPKRWEHARDMILKLGYDPKKVLDIGCGDGFISQSIKNIYPNAEVFGIDISKTAIAIAQNKYPIINFQTANAEEKLPFEDNFFDLVFSGEHIEHIKDTDTYLEEINRVMRKGGVFIITTPNLAYWVNRLLLLFGFQPFSCEASLKRKFPLFTIFGKNIPDNSNFPPAGHLRIFTPNNLKMLLEFYGFKSIQMKGSSLLKKPIIREIDFFLSMLPSLAHNIILKTEKK